MGFSAAWISHSKEISPLHKFSFSYVYLQWKIEVFALMHLHQQQKKKIKTVITALGQLNHIDTEQFVLFTVYL